MLTILYYLGVVVFILAIGYLIVVLWPDDDVFK